MTSDSEGSCNCGAIRLKIKGGLATAKGQLCHCNSCRKCSGALAAYMASIKLSALEVTQGTPKVWHETAGTMSGTPNHRYFCGDCGSPLWAVFHEGSEVVDVMPALFEVDCGIVGEFFWKNAFEWEKPMAPEGKVRETQ